MIPVYDDVRSRTVPFMTVGLILLNTVVFLYELSLGSGLDAFISHYALTPAVLLHGGGSLFGIETIFTSMFLHAGWLHLLGNMLFLWIFGDNVEDRLGHVTFLGFYLAAGVLAALAQVAAGPVSTVPTLGASGAIAGVLGAYLILYPGARVLTFVPLILVWFIRIPAWIFLLLWFGLQLASGVLALSEGAAAAGGVAVWAHVGGFASGVVAGVWARGRTRGIPMHRAV